MMLALVWQPVFSTLAIIGSAVVLAALTLFAWVRSRASSSRWSALLAVMRLAAIGVMTVVLFGPSRELDPRNKQTDARVCILLDTSESMLVDDCEGSSRIAGATAEALDIKRLARLEQDYRLELQGFDTNIRAISLDGLRQNPTAMATGRETRLADAVMSTVGRLDAERDALLVISDGRDTADETLQPAASLAASKSIPIYAVAMGGASTTTDAALMAIPMQDALLPNEAGGLLVRVYQSGLDGQQSVVRIRNGLAEQQIPVSFGEQKVVELQAPIRQEQPGQYEYTVTLDGIGDETELANNSQHVFVEVMKRRLRVLILEGQPFWDTKFLAQSLRKDEQLEILQLTQVGDRKRETLVTRESQSAPRLPESAEDWAEFDVVILGRGIEHLLDEESAGQLANWVDAGGHLVLARGRPFDPEASAGEAIAAALEKVDPVEWGDIEERRYSLDLSPSGRTSSWFAPSKMQMDLEGAFQRLPGFELLFKTVSLKPATLTLATAKERDGVSQEEFPAIVKMNAGRGDVVALLGEGTWKWSLLAPELQDMRGFYDLFWSNLIRWLALGGDFQPGQQTSLQLSRSSVRLGDEMTADIVYRFAPDGLAEPRVQVIGPDNKPVDIAVHRLPGPSPRFRASWNPEFAGVYRVVAETPSMTPPQLDARFNVYDVNVERLHTSANPLALQMLADASGGALLKTDELDDLPERLARHRNAMQAPPRLEYIWDKASVMLLLLGWLGAEWLLRRMAGLW
jgi:hypothetical protein